MQDGYLIQNPEFTVQRCECHRTGSDHNCDDYIITILRPYCGYQQSLHFTRFQFTKWLGELALGLSPIRQLRKIFEDYNEHQPGVIA